MAEKYLLTLKEMAGGNDFFTQHLIEAESYQHVKYHYHRTMKDWGYHDQHMVNDKHCLVGPNDIYTEIRSIEPLDNVEYEIMEDYIHKWMKV